MKEKALSVLLCCLLFLMLAFAPSVCAGAAKGLILWYRQVLPALMPFTLIVQLMMSGNTVLWLSRISAPLIRKIFGLSPACSFCLLTGYLCGFPMGALTAAQSLEKKRIRREEAQLLAASCNNAGPMFLSSYILDQLLKTGSRRPVFIVIFYGSALLWMWLRSRFLPSCRNSIHDSNTAMHEQDSGTSFRDILLRSSELMLKVGITMMIFAIFCEVLYMLPGISPSFSAAAAMLLEITNGACAVSVLELPDKTKTVLIMGGTAFGGLCIAFQTYTVIHAQKLSLIKYLLDKAAISLITGILTLLYFQISAG